MTILVTGGAGYIGSHMVLALLDAGHQPVVLDSLVTGFRDAVPPEVAFIEGNVGNVDLVREVCRRWNIDTVIHFAASTVVPESIEKPLDYYANNTLATHGLLQACVDEGVRSFVFSSTAAVYGEVGGDPVGEDAAIAPISPYGASKAMSERILKDVCSAAGMRFGILRYFNVAGADPAGRAGQRTANATHLIKVGVQAALGYGQVSIFGTDFPTPDGTGVRDYIHVSDLADAHLRVLEALKGGSESLTLNCGYGHGYSVRQVLSVIEQEAGVRLQVAEGPRRPGDAAQVIAGIGRVLKLGWRPRHDDLAVIVRSALNFERHAAKL